MVAVDPRRTVSASKADRWLPIRSGTDMALGLAMIHHILAHGLHDAAFCADWVLGWERWRDFVLEKGYTPGWAAPITGLAARSAEHTSELQSLMRISYAVFCLQKKKTRQLTM